MKKHFHNLLKRFSEVYRINHYRKSMAVPEEYYDPNFTVQIATTQDDLKKAYALLHDSYVGISIIDPQPSGLRCNLFSFLPTTSVVVAKFNGQVVGTVTLIKDSNSGLPSDRDFPEENAAFRRQGKSLVEISALAVAPEFRGKHAITFLLTAFLYTHCRQYLGCDYMLAAVHPKSETYYKALMGFKKNGKPLYYSNLKQAAAIHISMDLSEAYLQKLISWFPSSLPSKNFGTLLAQKDSRFQSLKKIPDLQISPVITPALLQYFCLQQKEVWSRLSETEQRTLIQVYSTFFGKDSVTELIKTRKTTAIDKDYRTPVYITAVVTSQNGAQHFCRILDLNAGGCFIKPLENLPNHGENVKISFRFRDRDYRVTGQIAWRNEGQAGKHHPHGIGIKFNEKIPRLNRDLQQWIYGICQTNDSNHSSEFEEPKNA